MKVGDQIEHNKGALMTVIGYRSYRDIDVRFDFESGESYIAEHKRADMFTSTMKYPARYDYVGMTGVNKCTGKKMTIVDYRTYKDISVLFEDGEINEHTGVEQFNRGIVKDPSVPSSLLQSVALNNRPKTKVREEQAKKFIGKTKRCKNGLYATITAWRTSIDFDVTFDDGIVVTGVTMECFRNGTIRHPGIRVETEMTTPRTERIGETKRHIKTGMMMKIVGYRGAQDLDVQFEDGTIAEHRTYTNFKKGKIQYPDKELRLGEVIEVPRIGLSLKITSYRAAQDIDVEYEDGIKITSVNYKMIRKSPPKHPIFDSPKGKVLGNFELIGLAFRTNETPYFYCRRLDAENSAFDVMTPREMLEENKEKQYETRRPNEHRGSCRTEVWKINGC